MGSDPAFIYFKSLQLWDINASGVIYGGASVAKSVTKRIGAIVGLALIFSQASTAAAGVREQAAALHSSAGMWVPVNYTNTLTFYADP